MSDKMPANMAATIGAPVTGPKKIYSEAFIAGARLKSSDSLCAPQFDTLPCGRSDGDQCADGRGRAIRGCWSRVSSDGNQIAAANRVAVLPWGFPDKEAGTQQEWRSQNT